VVDLAPADYGLMGASILWNAPSALWLLLLVPVVYLAHRVARTNFNPSQSRLQAALRSLLLALLVLALARPIVATRSERQSIVYAVDVSHSIGSPAIVEAARRIDEINTGLRPAHSRIVVFGSTVRTIADTAALRALAQLDPASEDPSQVDRRGTDLEAALDAARGELATDHVPRIVFFSDGRPTAGDVRAAIARLATARIPVSIEPLAVRSLGDTWVDSVVGPERIHATANFPVTVTIGSQREGTAAIELRSGTKVLARQSAPISKGLTPVTVDAIADVPGSLVLEAAVSVSGDPLAANNTLARGVWVEPRVRVLYVEGAPASARYLSGALTGAGFDVAVRTPAALPATPEGFDPYDVVILSDVARAAVPVGAMAALPVWVEQGGGLLFAGGEAVFGEGESGAEGGYRDTPIERLTPVTFERRDEPSLALVLVLDRSWSMAGSAITLSKAAAQAAVDAMAADQSVGILTFNDAFDWDVGLRNVGKNRDSIRTEIAAIEPSGGTLIYPALEQAYLALRSVKARAKHVVLLSDGRTYPNEYEALVQKMVAARITVSSIAVGASADQELLRDIARWGKGHEYLVADPKELPQIFVKEAKNAATPAFDEVDITPIVKSPAFLRTVDLAGMPPLKGFTATVMKDSALEIMTTPDGDPLLAFWPVGLGRTAVFASDVKNRWGAGWLQWRGYGPFFSALVHALVRQRPPAIALDVTPGPVRGATRSLAIALEARDGEGAYRDLLHPAVRIQAGTGASRDVPVHQVAPGRYEASVVADAGETLTVSMKGDGPAGKDDAGAVTRTIVPDRMAEYRFGAPDEALLKAIAAATGGAVRPTSAALLNAAGDQRTARRPLWPLLVSVALGLWFVDLLFRRIRVFE
jgi:Ca-activated chloride channel family protein